MNILAIGAHPDDLEYCCAGTLIQHAHRGDAVYLMIITDGDKGGDPEVRHREQLEAAKIIGAREVFSPVSPIPASSATANPSSASRRSSSGWRPTRCTPTLAPTPTRTTGPSPRRWCRPPARCPTCSSSRGTRPRISSPPSSWISARSSTRRWPLWRLTPPRCIRPTSRTCRS
ncbi:MAG: PIG-L family deacetylase [Candidatus Latescibacteria bacterium]|nr:PIG-L family deacetylase [Candidatus Latescibacterota bacterium]